MTRRILFLASLLWLLAPFASAQYTVATATVVDANGSIYANCTGSASFYGENTSPGAGPYLLNGSTFQTVVPFNCNGLGAIYLTLADNNVVSPTPSQWRVSVCSAAGYVAGPYCFNTLITITGATQSITAQLTAAAPLLPSGTAPTPGGVSGQTQIRGTNNSLVGTSPIYATQVTGTGNNDIGDKVNTAYASAACPATIGCHIRIPGATYSFSTPIVFGTVGKPVWLECDPGSTLLTFTPTTGTAITPNWGNYNANPASAVPHPGIFGCVFLGSGGSSIGMELSGGNGVSQAVFDGDSFNAFSTGIDMANTGNPTFLTTIANSYVSGNSVGVNIAKPAENVKFENDNISNNATAIAIVSTATSGDFYFQNSSMDSNSTAVLTIATGIGNSLLVRWLNNHIEDNGTGVVLDMFQLAGGLFEDFYSKIVIDHSGTAAEIYKANGGVVFLTGGVITSNTTVTDLVAFSNSSAGAIRDYLLASGFSTNAYYSASSAGQICVTQIGLPQMECQNGPSNLLTFGTSSGSLAQIANGSGLFNFLSTGQMQIPVTTGTAPLSITSTTPVANLAATPTTYNAAGTQQANAHIVIDTCTLGTSCSVTLVGAAAFTGSTTYRCSGFDTTAKAAIQFVPSSGSAFALTGTGTDVLVYLCVGD